MAQFVNIYKCDLHKGPVVTSLHQVFLGDVEANRVGVHVTDNGEDVTLSGTCSGTAILCNGGTVALTGTVDGSLAYVDLPSAVYTVEGPVEIYVTLTQGDQTTTLLTAHGNAVRTDSGVVIDPGTIIPSVAALISDIDDAVASIPADYSDLLGTIAPDFSSSTAYTAGQYVWYSGTLYRFTSDHAAGSWTGTDAIAAEIGEDVTDLKGAVDVTYEKSDDDVSDIRTALEYTQSANLVNPNGFTAGKVIDRASGILNDNADYKTSGFIKCTPGDVLYLTSLTANNTLNLINAVNMFRIGFYDQYYKYLSYNDYANSVTVPSGAAFFRFTLTTAFVSTPSVTANAYPTTVAQFVQYSAPYYQIARDVVAMRSTARSLLNLTTIDCWGDSMTEGGSSGKTYPVLLGEALGEGYTVNNYGKSSQTSGECAFRFGTNPVYIKLDGNQIPATTTAVTVDDIICTTGDRFTRRNFGNFAGTGVHCVVEGVSGMLNCLVGMGKSFTRDTAGDAVSTNGYVRVWNDENYSDENICIFWAGKNDTAMAATYTVKGTVDNIYGMTARMQHTQYIVLPVFKSRTETSGTIGYTNITAINNKLAQLYPNNYLDIQSMLIAHGLADAGITPTADDTAAIANDVVPPSLMAEDGIHPNEICRTVYVQYIKQFMQAKGWIA